MDINGGRRESCVPPGFRFHPTDEELVGYYLRKKVASHKIDLDVITDIDLYRIEPWDLQEKCGMGYEEEKEWYFFSHKDKKYPTGSRTNRATMAGFWKATGRDKAVYDKCKVIGMRKTLVFYKGRAPNGQKTDWIMHEYRLHSHTPPQEEGWVVCRAFKKRMTGQSKTSIEAGWDPTYYYDESTNILSHNLCKQEVEPPLDHHSQHYVQSDPFVQLPQLESPSLPPMKNPSTPISHTPKLLNDHNSEDHVCINRRSDDDTKKVTDWRDLDKFVASQLSHGDGYNDDDDDQILNIHSDSDLGLLLLQSGREEASAGPKLNELSTLDCDIGICIFNK